MTGNKDSIHFVYGIALILVGVGVFFRVPQIMPKVEQIKYFSSVSIFIRLCFYLIGIILIGGGSKKIFRIYKRPDENQDTDE